MTATYRCAACDASWKSDREPAECPGCGSPIIDRVEWLSPKFDNPYGAPEAALATSPAASSTAFSITYWMGWAALILGCVLIGITPEQDPNVISGLSILLGLALLCAAYILSLIKIYKAWELIQPLRRLDRFDTSLPSPGLAIGLLFVPLYNLYWNFVALHGLATRSHKYLMLSGIKAEPMNVGMAQTCCILTLCSLIPCLGYVAALINIFIYFFFILDVDRFRGSIQVTEINFLDEPFGS
jgi:hypothetical protein